MPRTFLVASILLIIGCAGEHNIDCVDVDLSDLEVDTTGDAPVISWSGVNVDDLSVTDEDYNSMWDASCETDDRPCISSSVTYGEQPSGATTDDHDGAYQLDALDLESGTTYSVAVHRYCNPDKKNDLYNVSVSVDFEAP